MNMNANSIEEDGGGGGGIMHRVCTSFLLCINEP